MFEITYRALLSTLALFDRRLSIVMFHRVLPEPDTLRPFENHAELFRQRVRWLATNFSVLTVRDAVRCLRDNTLPARALCITFDDGYADNADVALPILLDAGVAATFFSTTRYLDGGMMWNDRLIEAVRCWDAPHIDLSRWDLPPCSLEGDRFTALNRLLESVKYLDYETRDSLSSALLKDSGSKVDRLMMPPARLQALCAAGMEVGAHTHSHPIMAKLNNDALREELTLNRQLLQEITGTEISSFAYPNGRADQDFTAAHAALLRETGFECALTTMPGCAGDLSMPYQIPRFSPWDVSRNKYLLRLARNYVTTPRYAQPVT